ncbi:MAG: hypothetical protein KGJ88_11085 [Verrucomicrobiota bacterium]|nr:hypothetical protein [Verrucomicrobiota bacterium]
MGSAGRHLCKWRKRCVRRTLRTTAQRRGGADFWCGLDKFFGTPGAAAQGRLPLTWRNQCGVGAHGGPTVNRPLMGVEGGASLGLCRHGSSAINCSAAYDVNTNVAALVNAADGTVAANYEYGPFGELIRQTGPMAKANPFQFSTKYQDDESGLLYYGYRYYDASTGRWVNRDPLGETGFELVAHRSKADKESLKDELFKERKRAALNTVRLRINNPTLIALIDGTLSKLEPAQKLEPVQNGDPNRYLFARNDSIGFSDPSGLFCFPEGPWCYWCVVCLVTSGPEDPLCEWPCYRCAMDTANGSNN